MARRARKDSPRLSLCYTSHDNTEPFVKHGPVTNLPATFASIQECPVHDLSDTSGAIKESSGHMPTPGNQTVEYGPSQTEAWSNQIEAIRRPQRYGRMLETVLKDS